MSVSVSVCTKYSIHTPAVLVRAFTRVQYSSVPSFLVPQTTESYSVQISIMEVPGSNDSVYSPPTQHTREKSDDA